MTFTVIAPHTPVAPLGETPSGATGVWGSWRLISNQADMILVVILITLFNRKVNP